MREVVVIDSARTGMAKSFRGSFNLTRSDDMLAHCIDALLDRNPKLAPDEVEDVVVGAASHAGEQDGNLARLAVVLSRLPITTAGVTINRFCSSGLQSIAIAANQIASGQTEAAIAGGVDSGGVGIIPGHAAVAAGGKRVLVIQAGPAHPHEYFAGWQLRDFAADDAAGKLAVFAFGDLKGSELFAHRFSSTVGDY